MLRISTLLCVLFIVASGGFAQTNGKYVVGAHIEWDGREEPLITVVPTSRTLEIEMNKNKECVTVYSPPENQDYNIVIKTKTGTVTAGKPHPQGFQAKFCYDLVGNDQILRVHIWLGRAQFNAIDGSQRTIQAEEYVTFILPRSGKMQYVEGEHVSEPGTKVTYVEEDNKFRTVKIRQGERPRVKQVQPGEGEETEKTGETGETEAVGETQPERTQPVARPGEIIVPGQRVDVPPAPNEDPNTAAELQAVQLGEKIDATDAELLKYYGEKKKEEKKAEEAKQEALPWYENFELDHSTDPKLRLDVWLGLQRTRQSGSIRIDSETVGTKGDTLLFEQDLGMDEKDSSAVFGADFYWNGFHGSISATRADFEGEIVTTRNYTLGDTVYAAGSTINSEFEHRWIKMGLSYTNYLTKNLGIGFGGNIEFWEFEYRIQSAAATETASFLTIIPSNGVHVDFSPNDRWLITLAAYGTYFDFHDAKVWLANVTGTVRFFPCKYGYVFLRAEWEIAEYDLDDAKDVDLDADMYSSWNVGGGLGVRF